MNGRERRVAGVTLAALFGAVAAQAQDVHKCSAGGTVSYQSAPCPQGDVVLPVPPAPSDEEIRRARLDQSHQRLQADSGMLLRRRDPGSERQAQAAASAALEASINCEKLNQDNDEALDRREQVRVPSELPSHAELVAKAEADVSRIAQLATASHCWLKR